MSTARRVLIFDFDGVIVDSRDAFETALREACGDCGHPDAVPTSAAFLALFDTNMYEGLLAAGFPANRLDALRSALGRRLERTASLCHVFAGMSEALHELARTSPLHVVSSNIGSVVAGVLARQGLNGIADILGAERGTGKVAKIADVRRRHPDAEAYYVGDTVGDVLEGRAAGAVPVAVTWGWHERSRLLAAKPDIVVASPKELIMRLAPGL